MRWRSISTFSKACQWSDAAESGLNWEEEVEKTRPLFQLLESCEGVQHVTVRQATPRLHSPSLPGWWEGQEGGGDFAENKGVRNMGLLVFRDQGRVGGGPPAAGGLTVQQLDRSHTEILRILWQSAKGQCSPPVQSKTQETLSLQLASQQLSGCGGKPRARRRDDRNGSESEVPPSNERTLYKQQALGSREQGRGHPAPTLRLSPPRCSPAHSSPLLTSFLQASPPYVLSSNSGTQEIPTVPLSFANRERTSTAERPR